MVSTTSKRKIQNAEEGVNHTSYTLLLKRRGRGAVSETNGRQRSQSCVLCGYILTQDLNAGCRREVSHVHPPKASALENPQPHQHQIHNLDPHKRSYNSSDAINQQMPPQQLDGTDSTVLHSFECKGDQS